MHVPERLRRRGSRTRTALYLACLVSLPVSAHEYWIAPVDYRLDVGEQLLADTRNGQDFVGDAFPYDPFRYRSLYLAHADERLPVQSRRGDYPAIHPVIDQAGQFTVVLDSTERSVTYDSWEKFVEFLDYHGFDGVAEQHVAAGFSTEEVQEIYYRHAKSLITVGDHSARSFQESDPGPQGQELEIVLLSDPYSESDTLDIELLYRGEPLPDRQIEVFRRGSEVVREVIRSDEEGRATVDISNPGEYMVNAVQLIALQREDSHWMSLWSSFTFDRQ